MITVRRASDRFHTHIDWLDSRHSFSFGEHYDPRHVGFRDLLVINEDRITPRAGFPTHGHRDMEILSYVLEGELAHKDSLGNGSVIVPGDVQRMTAGTGVRHSEHNPRADVGTHFLQIWIQPEARGIAPSYEQRRFEDDDKRGRLRLVASRDGRDASVTVHQDMSLYATLLAANDVVTHEIAPGRHLWVQVIRGAVVLDVTSPPLPERGEGRGEVLGSGDGAAVSDATRVTLTAREPSELLVFDLA